MTHDTHEHSFDTVVVGGSQAGLAVGYYLAKQDRDFVILDAGDRVGGAWRSRWDSLRLFTPAAYSGLPGMRFPASEGHFPTKDEMADYLEVYAERFDLPVRLGTWVDALTRNGERYVLDAGSQRFVADRVVVATGPFHHPNVPGFADGLDPSITQLHSSTYRTPDQLPDGGILVVGAGNSGAEIAMELAATGRHALLSSRHTGRVPAGFIGSRLRWWLGWRLLECVTADTRLGSKAKEYDRKRGTPLIGLRPEDIIKAGVERVPRVEGAVGGKPQLANGRVPEVASVVWATGFRLDFGWIELPIFDVDGYPIHHRGVVDAAAGLYFLVLIQATSWGMHRCSS